MLYYRDKESIRYIIQYKIKYMDIHHIWCLSLYKLTKIYIDWIIYVLCLYLYNKYYCTLFDVHVCVCFNCCIVPQIIPNISLYVIYAISEFGYYYKEFLEYHQVQALDL